MSPSFVLYSYHAIGIITEEGAFGCTKLVSVAGLGLAWIDLCITGAGVGVACLLVEREERSGLRELAVIKGSRWKNRR